MAKSDQRRRGALGSAPAGLHFGRRVLQTLLVGSLVACLAGCYSPSLDIPAYSQNIAPCPPRSTPYPVVDIPKHGPVPCDIGGETLIFPNHDEVTATTQGGIEQTGGQPQPGRANRITRSDEYQMLDFGTFGMIIGKLNTKTCKTSWWGTDEGLARYWGAFGKKVHDDLGGECGTPG